MKPECVQEIFGALHDKAGPLNRWRDQRRTLVTEIALDGSKSMYGGDGLRILGDDSTTPGELVVVRTVYKGVAHELACLAKLGYLVVERPAETAPYSTNPQLELISTSNPNVGAMTESVFRDHNPQG